DPRLQSDLDLSAYPVVRVTDQQNLIVCERYTCDASGSLRVRISAEPTGYTRNFVIGQTGAAPAGSAAQA
ncbi:MAG: hypothetical protein WB622_12235, partial [Acidobacteriaceae bacterium]